MVVRESVPAPHVDPPDVSEAATRALAAIRGIAAGDPTRDLESNKLDQKTQVENWDSWSFLQMLDDVVHAVNPGVVRGFGAKYKSYCDDWAKALRDYQKQISDVTEGLWTGEAASSANTAVSTIVGDFPDAISGRGDAIKYRLDQVASNFEILKREFEGLGIPESRWVSGGGGADVEFNTKSLGELENYYKYQIVSYEDSGSDYWKFADYTGHNDEAGERFEDFKRVLDLAYTAATQGAALLRAYYSEPIQASMLNFEPLPKTETSTGQGPDGPAPSLGSPSTGNGGGAGGTGSTPPRPDTKKVVDDALKKLKAQQIDKPNTNSDPFQQVASTAGQALSSMGSQAQQAAQQALSQAQQAAQKAAQQAKMPKVDGIGGMGASTASGVRAPGTGGAGSGAGGAGKGGGAGGAGTGGAPEKPAERTTKTGTTQKASTTATGRPAASLSQAGAGMGGGGAGAPGAGGRGGAGGDKVHKVLKALRTRVNGEAVAGSTGMAGVADPVVEGAEQAADGAADSTRT